MFRGQSEITHLPQTVVHGFGYSSDRRLGRYRNHQLFPWRVNRVIIPAKIRKSRALAEHETCTLSDGGVSQKRVGHF